MTLSEINVALTAKSSGQRWVSDSVESCIRGYLIQAYEVLRAFYGKCLNILKYIAETFC